MKRSQHRSLRRFLFLPLLILVPALVVSGCGNDPSSSTSTPDDEARIDFGGSFSGGEVVLERIVDDRPDGRMVIELVARRIEVNGTSVSFDVAMRNESERTIGVPALLFLGDFRPDGVRVTNSDDQLIDLAPGFLPPEGPYPSWFDYSATFGEDQILSPGETSTTRTWIFSTPDGGSFSFGAAIRVGLDPQRARIAGQVFFDENANGERDADEAPFAAGFVEVEGPGNIVRAARIDDRGRWQLAIERTGLYTATFFPPPTLSFAPLCYSTPNPLEIVITPGPDGNPRSLAGADFGVFSGPNCDPTPPPEGVVQLVEGPPDSIESDFFRLLGARVIASPGAPGGTTTWFVEVRVGTSGCGPDHPLELFAGENFMESSPPMTWLRLSHDDLGELCDAYWEETRLFDLSPLVRRYRELYGDEVMFDMRLEGMNGESFVLSVP